MRSPFVSFLAKIALLLLSLATTVVVGGLQIVANHPDHSDMQYKALRSAASGATAVVFGSSTAVRAYDPRILATVESDTCGFAGLYNLAMVGSQPRYWLAWYKRVLRPAGLHPQFAIVSLDWFSLTDWRELEQDSRYWTLGEFWRQLRQASPAEAWTMLLNLFPFLRAGADVRYLVEEDFRPVARYDKGFLPIDGIVDLRMEGDRRYVWEPEHLSALREFLRVLRSDNVNVLLVQAPVYNPAGIHDLESTPRYQRAANEADVPFLDYLADRNSPFTTQYALYQDWVHFNTTGATLFSQTLRGDIADLVAKGMLECR